MGPAFYAYAVNMSEFLLEALNMSLASHGLPCERESEGIRTRDDLCIEPRVFPRPARAGTVMIQVDFAVTSPRMDGVLFLDSFAGFAPTRDEAEKDALGKFLRGSFHGIIEALTTHACDSQQVEWEHWRGAGGEWRVCLAPVLLQSANAGERIGGFQEFFAQLVRLFESRMPCGPHWMRVFLASYEGRISGSEVLVDGTSWEPGETLLASHGWSLPTGYSTIRHLSIALPATG